VVAVPLGLTTALSVALVWPRAVAAPVVTRGGGGRVVSVRSAVTAMPSLFTAISRKWYVVDGVRPLAAAETDRVGPPPTVVGALLLPYAFVSPQSKRYVVDVPFGVTVPLSVALKGPVFAGALVVALGPLPSLSIDDRRTFVAPRALVATMAKARAAATSASPRTFRSREV
jgi:hypothetical protein